MTGESIIIFSEKIGIVPQLVAAGKQLCEKVGAELYTVFIGGNLRDECEKSIKLGANKSIIVNTGKDAPFPEECAQVLTHLTNKYNPKLVLIGATGKGKEVAPRLAAKLKAGCVSECIGFEVNDSKELICKRLLFGGLVVGDIKVDTPITICTVVPDYFESPEIDESRKGEVIEEKLEISPSKKKLVEAKKIEKEVDLTQAEKIVAVGRGITKKEDLNMIFELAKILNAEVGCSRPISEDFKWLPKERQVGLTGVTVKPKLYLAIGISGQIQHVVGMKDSKVVVAINKNRDAPIFEEADYGIVGDLYKVIPALISELQKVKG